MIHENQNKYYAALNDSNTAGESTIFVTFMLNLICKMLQEIEDNQNKHNGVGINVGINMEQMTKEEKVLTLLKNNSKMTTKQLANTLRLSDRQIERIIATIKKKGKLERVGAKKEWFLAGGLSTFLFLFTTNNILKQ